MKMYDEKKSSTGYFRVGYDRCSEKYLLETQDTFGNCRYYIITEEQYQWFDEESNKLEALVKRCMEENSNSDVFYFSTWEKENTYEQNRLMWKYTYIDMLIGKERVEIHRKIGEPDNVTDECKREVFRMSSKLEIQVEYDAEICIGVKVQWDE